MRAVALGTVLCALLCAACGVLPPGYEDVLYCPDGACLRKNAHLPTGWSGPRTRRYDCVDPIHNDAVSTQPRGWGNKSGIEDPETEWAGWSPAPYCAEAPERTPPWTRLLLPQPYISGASSSSSRRL
jgi:hypothetical protein